MPERRPALARVQEIRQGLLGAVLGEPQPRAALQQQRGGQGARRRVADAGAASAASALSGWSVSVSASTRGYSDQSSA